MRLPGKFPRTITGQITLLIGLSLLLANALSIGAMYFFLASDTGRTPPVEFGRAATIAQLIKAADSQQKTDEIIDLAARIGIPIARVSGSTPSANQDHSTRSVFLQRRALEHFLAVSGLDATRDRVTLGPNHTIVMQLADGNTLAFPISDRGGLGVSRMIVAPVVYIVTAIAVVLVGLSLYAARFVTSPLSSFAAAANAAGRTVDRRAIISEKGPLEIVQVARALNEMHRRISALLDERVGMLTAISHDLRTPLTRIRLRAERILRGPVTATVAENMLTDVSRMEQMLAETLTYMRDNTRAEPSLPVDLPSVLETICVELADLGKAVSYVGPGRLVYRCQPGTLTRAVSNLVDNGIKYGTKVVVELAPLSSGAVQIDICDNGPGIPYSLRKRVFEPFFKTDSARTANGKEGFGLGLSIARNIIKAHGGEIELLAAVPHGTRVRITLPSVPEQNGLAESDAANSSQHYLTSHLS
jgi:signal transduction histidine kinase